MMLKIYGASKLRHAPLWRQLRDDWNEFQWTARWPDSHIVDPYEDEVLEAWRAQEFWKEDETDIRNSDVVLLYAEPNDVPRGMLVEAGMGIGFGKLVIVTGDHPAYGTWQHHPRVYQEDTLEEARKTLHTIAKVLEGTASR